MFYPINVNQEMVKAPVRALVSLTPAESRRLVAKAVAVLPEVRQALTDGIVCIGRGVTNAFVLEEITGSKIEPKSHYAAGIIMDGELSVVPAGVRMKPVVLRQGKPVDVAPADAVADFKASDVFIKGANCVDPAGNVGVLVAGNRGGTVGEFQPIVQTRGSYLIVPVGLEKLIPSVEEASWVCGVFHFKYSTGLPAALIPLPNALVVTEIQAFGILCGAKGVQVAAGGVAGSEGTVVLSLEGSATQIEKVMSLVKSVKGEPPVTSPTTRSISQAVQFNYDAMAQWNTLNPPAPPK